MAEAAEIQTEEQFDEFYIRLIGVSEMTKREVYDHFVLSAVRFVVPTLIVGQAGNGDITAVIRYFGDLTVTEMRNRCPPAQDIIILPISSPNKHAMCLMRVAMSDYGALHNLSRFEQDALPLLLRLEMFLKNKEGQCFTLHDPFFTSLDHYDLSEMQSRLASIPHIGGVYTPS